MWAIGVANDPDFIAYRSAAARSSGNVRWAGLFHRRSHEDQSPVW